MNLKYLIVFLIACTVTARSQNIDSLLVAARTAKNDSVSITKLNLAGYYAIFRDAGKAFRILHEARSKAQRTHRTYNLAEVTNTLGVYHDVTANRDSAGFYFSRALQMSRNGRYRYLEVRSTNNLGMLNWNRGKFNEALTYFLKALEINEKLPDKPGKTPDSSMLNNIGLIYQEMNLFAKALAYHEKAYSYRLAKNKKHELPISLNNMGICLERLGKRTQAETTYLEGIKLAKTENRTEYYKLLENYSGILIDKADYNGAVALLQESLNRPAEMPFPPKTKLSNNSNLANAYINLLQPENAVKYAQTGLAILKEHPELEMYAEDLYLSASRAYYMMGDVSNGHIFSQQFAKNTRSRFSRENAAEMADLEIRYETEKKEKQIAEGRLQLLRAAAEVHANESIIAQQEADLLKSEAAAERKEKLIAVNRTKLLKSEAESGRKGRLIAENKATLLQAEANARNKNFMFMIALCFIGFLSVIGYLIYRQQRLKNRQLQKEYELKTALAEIENQNRLQEQRLSISRDLHDNIGAQLTFIISTLDSLKFRLPENIPAVGNKIEGISNFTRQTIVELRDTIWAMNTKQITFEDLKIRIMNFIEKAQQANEGIDFRFTISPLLADMELTSVTGMNIYRIIQEAINNTIKHADATTVEVNVFDDSNGISITISDNGKGFTRAGLPLGNGLFNMEKRAEGIGGTLTVTSEINNGTFIKINLQRQMQIA